MTDLTRPRRNLASEKDLPRVESIDSLEEAKSHLNDLIDAVNNRGKLLGITKDTDSDLIEGVTIAASATEKIRHRLRVVPKYRIILRQSGGGAIIDGSGWDANYVYLTNTGASTATITLLLLKE